MYFFGITVFLVSLLAVPIAARAADQVIQAAETSVWLGISAGYDGSETYGSNFSPRDQGLIGVTAGVSDLSTTFVPGFSLPDLYANLSYCFYAGISGGQQSPYHRSSMPFAGKHDSYSNSATVGWGRGRLLVGVWN